MPNWPISQAAKNYLTRRAVELSSRALAYAQDSFPLSVSEIQHTVMDREKVTTMRRLIQQGVRTIEKHHTLRCAFLRGKFPELRRGCVLQLTLPEWIVVDRGTQYGMSTTRFEMDDSHYLVPDFDMNDGNVVDVGTRAELIAWLNRAIRQKRLHEILVHTVNNVLNKHTPTVMHLHHLWPMLTTLMNNDPSATNARFQGDREFYELWIKRFRAPGRKLRSYQPARETVETYGKLIHACDTVLSAGSVLASYKEDDKVVQAEIQQWEPVDGDRTFS